MRSSLKEKEPEASSAPTRTSRGLTREYLQLSGLLLGTFLVFYRVLGFDFVYDDDLQILRNSALATWRNFPDWFTHHLWYQLPGLEPRYYRPALSIWLYLNRAAFGLHAWGPHLTSLLLHLAATALAYFFSKKLLGQVVPALVAAAVFAVHPLHIETAAWISDANDSLMAIFIFAALLSWERFRDSGARRFVVLSAACFVGALLSKEIAVMFPIVLLAWEWTQQTPSRPTRKATAKERRSAPAMRRIQYFGPLLMIAIVGGYFLVRSAVLGAIPNPAPTPAANVLATSGRLLWFYIEKVLWPVNLSCHYPEMYQSSMLRALPYLLGSTLVCFLLFALYRRSQDKRIAFALVWFLTFLAPALDVRWLANHDAAHDRYLYLPLLGFAWLFAILVQRGVEYVGPANGFMVYTVVGAELVILALATMLQLSPWSNDLALFSRGVTVAPENPFAHLDLAAVLSRAGRCDLATPEYQRVVPTFGNFARWNIGMCQLRSARYQDAVGAFQEILQLDPNYADAMNGMGLAYMGERNLSESEMWLRRAIATQPAGWGYHLALGRNLKLQRRYPEARSEFEQEILVTLGTAGEREARGEIAALPAH